jgi:hypothetical protein
VADFRDDAGYFACRVVCIRVGYVKGGLCSGITDGYGLDDIQRWVEFLALNALGRGTVLVKVSATSLAIRYAGACCQFTTGRMGVPGLCIFGSPFRRGGGLGLG